MKKRSWKTRKIYVIVCDILEIKKEPTNKTSQGIPYCNYIGFSETTLKFANLLIHFNGRLVDFVSDDINYKWLGIILDPKLNFKLYIAKVVKNVENSLNNMKHYCHKYNYLDWQTSKIMYDAMIKPLLLYSMTNLFISDKNDDVEKSHRKATAIVIELKRNCGNLMLMLN